MVQREVDGPGQQSWEAPAAEGNLRKAQPGTSRSPSAGLGRLAPLHASKAICRFSFDGRQFQSTHWVTIPSVCTPGWWPCCPSASEHCSDPSCIENIVPESPDADTSLSQCCGLGEITAMWWLFSASRVGLTYVRMCFIAGVHIRDADHQSQRELRRKLQMWGHL